MMRLFIVLLPFILLAIVLWLGRNDKTTR